MTVRRNELKRRLKRGETVQLCFVRLPEPGVVEILGYAGFDGVIIDTEHGGIGWSETERMILAAYAADITPLVRIQKSDPQLAGYALDLGALGVIAPHVGSAAEAGELRDGALYPPEGHRAIGIGRPAKWSAIPQAEYFTTMNSEVLVGAMVESAEAAAQLDAIAAAGLDLLILGPSDLSAALGELGAPSQPKTMAVGDELLAAASRHAVAVGIPSRTREASIAAIKRGYRVIAWGTVETIFLQHLRDLVRAVRGEADLIKRKHVDAAV
jgi:4-hydroxy-2-oxoheptanedioate aldolase